MPAVAAPLAAAERRRSFEAFLGIGEVTVHRRRRKRAGCHRHEFKTREGECNLRGEWTQLPERASRVRLQKLHGGHTSPLWSTSFEAHTNDENAPGGWHDKIVNVGGGIMSKMDGVMTKSNAILLGVMSLSAGAGFVAAMVAPARPELTEAQQAAPAAEAMPSTALGSPPTAAVDAGPGAASAAEDREDPEAPTEPTGPSPEEIARLALIAELETQRTAAAERHEQLLADFEERKQELQPSLDEVDAELQELDARIAEEEAAPVFTAAPPGEAAEPADARRAAEEAFEHGRSIYESLAPSVLAEGRVKRIVDERVASARERIPELVTEELNSGINDLTSALEEPLPAPGAASNMDDLPTLSLMIAGLFAPTQLSWQKQENLSKLQVSAALLFVDALVLGLGWNLDCVTWIWGYQGRFLKAWVAVDAAALAFNVVVRIVAMKDINTTVEQMKIFQDAPLILPPEPGTAFKMQLQRQLVVGAQAMIQYDSLARTPSYRMLDGLAAFDFIWQIGGIALLFDTPGEFCLAGYLMSWARIRGVVFLIAIIPSIISLGFTAAKAGARSQKVCLAILKGASAIDKAFFPDGPAIATILVRVFLVRDATDMQDMQTQVMEFEKLLGEQERDWLKTKYEAAEAALAKEEEKYEVQAEIVREKSKEEEFLMQYQEAVTRMCGALQLVSDPGGAAADIASQIAANVREGAREEHEGRLASTSPRTGPRSASPRTRLQPGDDDAGGDGGTGSSTLGGQLAGSLASAGSPRSAAARAVPKAAGPPGQQGGLGSVLGPAGLPGDAPDPGGPQPPAGQGRDGGSG